VICTCENSEARPGALWRVRADLPPRPVVRALLQVDRFVALIWQSGWRRSHHYCDYLRLRNAVSARDLIRDLVVPYVARMHKGRGELVSELSRSLSHAPREPYHCGWTRFRDAAGQSREFRVDPQASNPYSN
jgi:hypothetical protein